MAIRITRNEEGNCINFVGSSNPAYWNACLSAVINSDDSNRLDIVNDIRSLNSSDTQYEFYAVEFTEFADRDGNTFANAQAAVDYINANANVVGVSDVGADLTDTVVNFRLDQTSTSIIMDNGSSFGVNTIKAVADADGTIHIHAIGAGVPSGTESEHDHKHFEQLDHTNVQVNGSAVSGGLQDVVNTLNELFTVGPFEAVVIADPYSTMVADTAGVPAGYTLEGIDVVDPVGDDLATSTKNSHKAGIKSTATINQAGEYFTFQIRGEGQIGMGLVHTQDSYDDGYYSGNATYADPTQYKVGNSQHYGFQFSHHFHQTPNGPWTNYGANTSYSQRSGWSNATDRFISSDEGADWLAGNPVKIKCGIDENGYISISYWNESQARYIPISRSGYPVPQGSEYHLGVSTYSASARLHSAPQVHLLEEEAPTMYFRYIESPDNNFEYPLFATEEEANYYDEQAGGSGTSHTHTYDDDATNTTWYMPDTGGTMTSTSAPTGDTVITAATYTEITSLTNADLTPTQFSSSDYTHVEGTVVNYQLFPAGATFTQTVTVSPAGSGMVYNNVSGYLQGTLSDVTSDTLYTVEVTRANSYGSNVGSFEVQVTDVPAPATNSTDWSKALDFSGSNEHLKQVSSQSFSNALRLDNTGLTTTAPTWAAGTSASYHAKPWATAIVFNIDNVSQSQHIWNQGEGAANGNDNIYLRLNSSKQLIFGWGREGSGYNECTIHPTPSAPSGYLGHNAWYGVYIAHNGRRMSSSDATAANLAAAFDIRIMNSAGNNWTLGSNLSVSAAWTSTGARMDYSIAGDFTIGGRGNNRSFRGEVASMVVTTLKKDVAMPSNAEIDKMVTDPMGWLDDYKVGNNYRYNASNNSNFQKGVLYPSLSTQVWLMGDGTSDSYGNGIRNQVNPSEQNYGKMQLNSMVSNDIQTVNITGLT